MESRHFLIEGKVQGVWYRASAEREARRLGLDGWVRNLADGRVEAAARGTPEGLAEFERWLWQGPSGARVVSVQVAEYSEPIPPGFEVTG